MAPVSTPQEDGTAAVRSPAGILRSCRAAEAATSLARRRRVPGVPAPGLGSPGPLPPLPWVWAPSGCPITVLLVSARRPGVCCNALTWPVTFILIDSTIGGMKVTAYLRVSTDRQAEQGFGLDVQRQRIRAWAKDHGHRVVSWHTDDGISGSNGLDSRRALPDAFVDLREGRAAGIVFPRLDRLARDLILQETLLREVRAMGAQAFSTMPGEQEVINDDPDDPSRRLIRQVLGAVGEYERSLIRLRLGGGRARKAEQGGYAYGSPPFGKRSVDGVLVDDPAEQAALARARQLRAAGASMRAIADTLTVEGHTPKRGGRWHPPTVQRMLARAAD